MEERNYKLYVHISPSNKRYYGITSTSTVQRWNNGKGYKTQYFYRAIKKYGWENFKHEILFDNLTKDEACLLEQCYITLYDTMNPKYGYNNTSGGEHYTHSDITCQKLSIANTGKHPTEETKRKISNSLKGKNHINYGRHLSEETRNKIRMANTGKHLTEEQKRKMRESLKGRTAWNKGKKLSEEHIRKLSEAKKGKHNYSTAKKICCVELNLVFDSIADANEYLGKDRRSGNIGMCVQGRTKTAWNYHWCYVEDLDNYTIPQKYKPNMKKVKCIELDKVFNSIAEANEYLGLPRNNSNININARGKSRSAWGYHWEYITEEQEELAL